MRKKEALALIITLALSLTAGCAPGDISRYAAKAQQAGESIFEGKAVPAAAEAADAGDVTEPERESIAEREGMTETEVTSEAEKSDVAENLADDEKSGEAEPATESERFGETESAAESVNPVGEDSATETESSAETESTSEPERFAETETAAGSESSAETESTSEPENAAETESTAESGNAAVESGNSTAESGNAAAESTDAATKQEQSRTIQLPAMMTEATERVQSALSEKADFISGSLAGKDALSKEQQDALQAVLRQQTYDDRTLCVINSAQYEGKQTGSFLLFGDSTALTARGRVSGDLWFYDGEKATRLLKDTEFLQQQTIQCGGGSYLLIQTLKNGKTAAQVYRIKGGRAVSCFTNAVSIEQEGEKLRVNYKSDHINYDPVGATWSGGEAEITYFYMPGEDGFEQEEIRALTAEQYLAYIQTEDAETQRLKEELEEKFYNTDTEGEEYRYSFFAIGDERIGYRECRIGMPMNEDEADHVAAEYTYHLAKLENGTLTNQCETLSGSGYYFAQWDQKKEELEALSKLPAAWLKNRIDRAARTLRAKERLALECVQEVQEYDADALCFVEQADYDGDGETESFVAVGRYDGILCAPVCDLWFVAGENPVLLSENLPVKNVLSYEKGGISLFLLEGFETDGARDRLYGVKDGAAQRLLTNASEIQIEENGDLTAKIAGANGELPYYYHISNGTVTEYGVREMAPEMLLDYDNGKAVYRQLRRLAQLQDASLSCLKRDNGLIHVMLTGQNGASYEIYRVSDGALVLIDCGDGGYGAAAPEAAGAQPGAAESETADEKAADGQAEPANVKAGSDKTETADEETPETENDTAK